MLALFFISSAFPVHFQRISVSFLFHLSAVFLILGVEGGIYRWGFVLASTVMVCILTAKNAQFLKIHGEYP